MSVQTVLPTLYEHYTSGGINAGLSDASKNFTLNNKEIFLYSGAVHYFRVPPQYWRDRLRKARAAGLNAVETYIPWNLHEPEVGKYDFGDGNSEWSDFLDIRKFLTIAKEEDLLVLLRPGPFICAEWEFGGLPSWLLRQKNLTAEKIRTSDDSYMSHVTRYFNVLLPILAMFQFTKGGSVIGLQLENEYASTSSKVFTPDKRYVEMLRDLMRSNGIVELLYTADSQLLFGNAGMIPGVLGTSNFGSDPEMNFQALEKYQQDKPIMCMEYWCGWFDHWTESHNKVKPSTFRQIYRKILNYPASVNLYMFHGGTSFGFLNGANVENDRTDNSGYQPDTTSYDYDAIINENGDYTTKYYDLKDMLSELNPIKTKLPDMPPSPKTTAYQTLSVDEQLELEKMLQQTISIIAKKLVPMEKLPINNGNGQSYGYIVYRIRGLEIPANSTLTVKGRVCDVLIVCVNGQRISKPLQTKEDLKGFGYWKLKNAKLTLGTEALSNVTLDLVVENWGRVNYGKLPQFNQFKGLWQGDVLINNIALQNFEIYPLEFKRDSTVKLQDFSPVSGGNNNSKKSTNSSPTLYRSYLDLNNSVALYDTYIDMRGWGKGIVIINGFVLGRYCSLGPQQSLYLPAPFLKRDRNEILIFEQFNAGNDIKFAPSQVFTTALFKQ